MATTDLTVARLRELLHYDQVTGDFVWRIAVGIFKGRREAGEVAGGIAKNGYWTISIDGTRYFAHRLAWLWMKGEWPPDKIDHRDTVRHHNWFKNLRVATNAQNQQNRRGAQAGNKSGLLGVISLGPGRWGVQIKADGVLYRKFGTFHDEYEAHAVYLMAKVVLHPFGTSA